MKTTMDLPDEILVKAKVMAAERRTTLRKLVVQGLQQVISQPSEDELAKRKSELKRLLKAMQASNTQAMVPLKRKEIRKT